MRTAKANQAIGRSQVSVCALSVVRHSGQKESGRRDDQNENLICNSSRRLLAFSENPSPLGPPAI